MNDLNAIANEGTLDPSFGSNGRVFIARPTGVLPLPQGKVIVVTSEPESFQLKTVRLNVDGTLDHKFGDEGVVELPLYFDLALRILPAMDGGWFITYPIEGGRVTSRQRPDGALDESFGVGGIRVVMYESPEVLSVPVPAAVQVTRNQNSEESTHMAGSEEGCAIDRLMGKIIFSGRGLDWPNPSAPAVWRLNPDGTLDKTLNGTGYVPIKPVGFEYEHNTLQDSTQLECGKILVLAEYDERGDPGASNLYLMRYNQDGSVDRDFNEGRALILRKFPYRVFGLRMTVRASDGRIVIGGFYRENRVDAGMILVLNASGSFNQIFNKGKPLLTNLNSEETRWRRCQIQEDGAIVVSGTLGLDFNAINLRVPIARFLPDGTLDPMFNGKGWNFYKDEPGSLENNHFSDMAITQDGRVVVCGFSEADGGWVLRYLA
ncbi:hypothetical protein D3C76_829410 [compost metagenome]|uniref:hypothetical protein n=1 Tax=Pseudomonas sp. ACN8 TaxID=1920428 RepID=UPI000BB2D449|nr:hypothetical protein [Pseudomonas sp. ACN8]PBJ24646.1 hypothetical protein BSF44_20210 [Pseudomonas sp. ACN8]